MSVIELWTCPNGHEFPPVAVVPCAYCEAIVACIPVSEALDLHRQLRGAVSEIERLKRVIRAAHNDLNDPATIADVRAALHDSLVFPPRGGQTT